MPIANTEQAKAWDGEEGEHWAAHAERYEHSSWRHRGLLLQAAAIASTDLVIDIGCGSGRATIEAARQARSGAAIGVDLSGPLLARATENAVAEGVSNISFVKADAQVHPFEADAADVAISLAGCMFFGDPVAAFSNIGAGLRRGGRLVLLAWRELGENEWLTTVRGALALGRDLPTPPPDAPTPFSLAEPDRVRSILGTAGFGEIDLAEVDEPIELGRDADDAYEFFRGVGIVNGLLDGVDEASRAQGLENLRAAFKEAETADGVLLGSAAWLITATRG
jgi:SAM-dependent methyltransferase